MPMQLAASNQCSRRNFLARSATLTALALCPGLTLRAANSSANRKMKICLNPGMIGVRANMSQSVQLAKQYGFEAVEANLGELASMSDENLKRLLDDMKSANIVLGSAGTSVPISGSAEEFNTWLDGLPKQAAALQRAGGKRVVTWISPGSNELSYADNLQLHAKRIGDIATVLGDHGISFGLEYIGPKTSWSRQRYPFVHTMTQMKELIAAAGKPNLGFLLDSWHWYTAGESAADILSLKKEDVVSVHINDAPAGIERDQQIDSKRALPAATGVIDIAGFLSSLNQIGYDGPVMAEPFDNELRKQPQAQALQRTIDAIRKAFNKTA